MFMIDYYSWQINPYYIEAQSRCK